MVKKKKVIKKKKKVVKSVKKKCVAKKKKSIGAVKKEVVKSLEKATAAVSLEEVGIVSHYFSHVEAAVVKLTKGTLAIGDSIVIKGHTTDFKEKINSIQLDHIPITTAEVGQEIGLKVKSRVRENDVVYKVVG